MRGAFSSLLRGTFGRQVRGGKSRRRTGRANKGNFRFRRPLFETLEPRVVLAAPIALDQALAVLPGKARNLMVLWNDADGAPSPSSYTVSIVSQPTQGTLTQVPGTANFTYTPNGSATGDTFSWKVNDGSGDSNIATVTTRQFQILMETDYVGEPDFSSPPYSNLGFGDLLIGYENSGIWGPGENHNELPEENGFKARAQAQWGAGYAGTLVTDIETVWPIDVSQTDEVTAANVQKFRTLGIWLQEALPNAEIGHYALVPGGVQWFWYEEGQEPERYDNYTAYNNELAPIAEGADALFPSSYVINVSQRNNLQEMQRQASEAYRVAPTKGNYHFLLRYYDYHSLVSPGQGPYVDLEESFYLQQLQTAFNENSSGVVHWDPHNAQTPNWSENFAYWRAIKEFTGLQDLGAPEIQVTGNGVTIADNDASPATNDHTDFGSVTVSGTASVERTFTITNSGNYTLTQGSVRLTGPHGTNSVAALYGNPSPADFFVSMQPMEVGEIQPLDPNGNETYRMTLNPGESRDFKIKFDPLASGTRFSTVHIRTNDPSGNEGTFNFNIWGNNTGGGTPEANVQGNAANIADGDTTPTTADHADFGSADVTSGTVTRTFTIQNTGAAALTVGTVTLSGTNAADFSVTAQPATSVAAGGSTTFQIRFDPSASGLRTAALSFSTNDSDENPYNFSILGTGAGIPGDYDGNGWVDSADHDMWRSSFGSTVLLAADGNGDDMVDAADYVVWRKNLGSGVAPASLYGIVEQSFIDSGSYSNPHTQVTATATLTRPDLTTWTIPLFWDGGDTWKLRVSPDQTGAWSWRIDSGDAGLNNPANDGSFTVVASTNQGGIQPMAGYPYHFQYENGEPFWWLGDMNWQATTTIASEGYNHTTALEYFDERASQGFNYISALVAGRDGYSNEGGDVFSGTDNIDNINPDYFEEVDARIQYANSLGITLGILPLWGEDWKLYNSSQRLRFADYLVARYGAYNVVFVAAGEYDDNGISDADLRSIGQRIAASDPHDRMVTVHVANHVTAEHFLDEAWISLDYQQAYGAQAIPIEWQTSAPSVTGSLHNDWTLGSRDHNKPVVNGEYTFYLLDSNDNGNPFDWPNSGSLEVIRNASWEIAMAGGYFVTSFGSTYAAGQDHPGSFNDNPAEADWEEDVQHIKTLFTDREWWKLQPSDSLLTGAGTHYALAEIGEQYLAYIRGNSGTNTLSLGGAPSATYAVQRFSPRTGQYTAVGTHTGTGPITLDPPDSQDYVFVVTRTVGAAEPEIDVRGGVPLISITDGDTTPEPADHTDFGSVDVTSGTVTRTFTILNTGSVALTLGTVTLSGTNAADFSVIAQPAASVATGGSTTFQVGFDPSASGLRTASLSFANNDATENPYDFAIQGIGTISGSTVAAEWKFSESSGTTAADSSGNGNTATLTNGPTFVAGQSGFGNALSLDGVNDYASVANSTLVNLTKNFTLSAWIRPDVVNLYQGIVTKVTGTADKQYVLEVSDNGELGFEYERAGNDYALSGGTLTAGAWQFVAATIDSFLNIKLYINGAQVASGTAPAEVTATTNPVNIGRYGGTYNAYHFDGLIDSARIHNTALSATEITNLYNQTGLHAAGPAVTNSIAASISEAALAPFVNEAIARWVGAGANLRALAQLQFAVADLDDNLLGLRVGSTIFVDRNAAGYGWFLDRTPWNDREFHRRRGDGPDGMDLLSVLAHEMGHALGYEHADHGVMEETLSVGERDAPSAVARQWRDAYFSAFHRADDDRWFAPKKRLARR